jgi:hypothetical protein
MFEDNTALDEKTINNKHFPIYRDILNILFPPYFLVKDFGESVSFSAKEELRS